jgi:hypothetical protein
MPISGVTLDGGGKATPSSRQLVLWRLWREFWDEWVPTNTHGEPYIIIHNGDAIDGHHHSSTTQWSHNIVDQRRAAVDLLAPELAKAEAYFHIRGTEAHVGQSGEFEEQLAKDLGAVPDGEGLSSRWELMKQLGEYLIHFSHHIGTTSSSAHESSAINAEISAMLANYGRAGLQAPQIVVRSHRHRNIEVRLPSEDGYKSCFTTAAWQLKTPYVYRLPGGRTGFSQIGSSLIRLGDEIHCRHFIREVPTVVVVDNTTTKRLAAPKARKALQ